MKTRYVNKAMQSCEPKDVHKEVEKQETIGNLVQNQLAFLCFFCADKKKLIIAFKNCLDLYFHALIV